MAFLLRCNSYYWEAMLHQKKSIENLARTDFTIEDCEQ
jgi:hypothetical protein